MTKYNVIHDNKVIKVLIIGHAENRCKTLSAVCGMISAVTQSALTGCIKYGDTKNYIMEKQEGKLYFETKSNKITRGIIYSMERGLEAIAENYPDYLRKE